MAHFPGWRTNLRQSHYDLLENLDLPPVLDYALSKGGLSQRTATEIREVASSRERALKFLDIIQDGPNESLKVFVDGLVKSKQEHLSRLIIGVGDAVVMTAQHKLKLKESRLELVQNMDPFMVITHLQSADVLTSHDAERMTSLEARVDQNAALLDTISRKPDHAFGHLVDALKKTKQAHLANLLQENGTRHDEDNARKFQEEIKKLRKEKDELNKKFGEEQKFQERKLQQMQDELARASSSLQEKDSLISKLQKELSELNHLRKQLTDFQEKEKALAKKFDQQMADHKHEVEQKNSKLKQLQSTIDKQTGELTLASDQMKTLEKELAEKENYILQLETEMNILKKKTSQTGATLAQAYVAPHSQTQAVSDLDTTRQAQKKLQSLAVMEETPKVQVHKTYEKDLTSAKLVQDQDISAVCRQIKGPRCVVPLDDGGLLVAHNDNRVLRVDQQGQQQGATYSSPSIPPGHVITALCVHQFTVLVMHSGGWITRLLLTDLSTALQTYKVSGYQFGGDVIDSDNIVFTNYHKACVCTYNLPTRRQQVVVWGLLNPTSVVYAQTSHGPVFVLTEQGTHQVHVYDERWGLHYSMGGPGSGDGQLNIPEHATVTSDGKSILVAECNNQRISQFSMTGQFIRHVLTQKDGIRFPLYLACRNEYVWIIDREVTYSYTNSKVMRFKFV